MHQPAALGPEEFTSIHAEMTISGLSMQASLASFLSMFILLIHMFLATLHIVYVVRKRHTSGSWSSVGELLALAQNSQPASSILCNIGGGIERASTYAQVAKIRVRRTPGSDQEHVELLFDGSDSDVDLHALVAQRNPRSEWHGDGFCDRLLRHPATWPNRRFGVFLTDEDGGPTTSTERLMPQASMENQEMRGLVQLDRSYG